MSTGAKQRPLLSPQEIDAAILRYGPQSKGRMSIDITPYATSASSTKKRCLSSTSDCIVEEVSDGDDLEEGEIKEDHEEDGDEEEHQVKVNPGRPLFDQLFSYGDVEAWKPSGGNPASIGFTFLDCELHEHIEPFSAGAKVEVIRLDLSTSTLEIVPVLSEPDDVYYSDLILVACARVDTFPDCNEQDEEEQEEQETDDGCQEEE